MAKPNKEPAQGIITNLFRSAMTLLAQPGITAFLTVKSEVDRFRAMRKKPKIWLQLPYEGQKILLLALYEKGELRPDTLRFLQVAKSAGLYVLAVNTLKLQNPASLSDLVDTYIERVNYGRDFGSYRTGFMHIFDNGWDGKCPRLLMVNDSVFFNQDRMPDFVSDMIDSEIEVLGSTENYEINYHLGSFCIALARNILQHREFRSYWKKYRLSDVRPVVIKRGEMGLSQTLRKCVSTQSQFRALFNSPRFAAILRGADDADLDEIIRLTRSGDLTPAKRFTFSDQFDAITDLHTVDPFDGSDLKIENTTRNDLVRTRFYVDSFSSLKEALADSVKHAPSNDMRGARETVCANLLDNFRQHSQIHQNAAILLKMGLPIIKLDGVFRGMFDMSDVTRIMELLGADEAREFEDILISRPYGGDVLIGWKRAAFMRGLI